MNDAKCNAGGIKQKLIETLLFGKQILLDPATVFRNMSKQGGFTDPLLFMAAMGLMAGIAKVLVTFYYMANGAAVSLLSALAALVIMPVTVVACGYLAAFLLSVVMKFLGGDSQLETAFRVVAYLSVVSPLAVLVLPVPYLGNLLILGIITYLLVAAAIEVYELDSRTVWTVFGVTFALLSVLAIGSQYASRRQPAAPPAIENSVEAQAQPAGQHD